MSGFPIKKTLDDFDFSFQPSIDKRQIDELATMRFLENGENVVFLGPPGVGKTHLASALGLVAAQHRFSTYYINCHQLIEQLKKAHFENRLPDKLNIVEVLDHIFSEEAKSKRRRAYEKQIQMSGFPIKKTLDDFDFSFQPSIDWIALSGFAA